MPQDVADLMIEAAEKNYQSRTSWIIQAIVRRLKADGAEGAGEL